MSKSIVLTGLGLTQTPQRKAPDRPQASEEEEEQVQGQGQEQEQGQEEQQEEEDLFLSDTGRFTK